MSDKPVAERLQVKGTRRLAVLRAPPHADALIGMPDARQNVRSAEVVILFVCNRREFDEYLLPTAAQMTSGAILWLAYPKLTSPLAADLNRDVIHLATKGLGLATVSQIAIDADWSALRLKRA